MPENQNITEFEKNQFRVLHFGGEPKAVQSFRFAQCGRYMRKFQPKEVTDWKTYIKVMAMQQLGQDFKPLAAGEHECIELRVVFTFPLRKSETKRRQAWVMAGGRIMHNRKPDVTDNLMKGLSDALTGVLWADDAKVCLVGSIKVDGEIPSIDLSVCVRPDMMARFDIVSYLRGDDNAIRWSVPVP